MDGRDGKPGFSGMSAIGVTGAGAAAMRRSGSLGGWAVGATPEFLPEGRRAPASQRVRLHPANAFSSDR